MGDRSNIPSGGIMRRKGAIMTIVGLQIVVGLVGERPGQAVMSDHVRAIGKECGVAEDMIGVGVRVDDIFYRQVRELSDGRL